MDEEKQEYMEEIHGLARGLAKMYEVMYTQCKIVVEHIIHNGVTNKETIERCLDMTMDILTDKGYQLFLRLCDYYATIDKEAAHEYLRIYDELYGEDKETGKPKIRKRSYEEENS